jgi:PIN domain nuclease of toxin-antitoxin system
LLLSAATIWEIAIKVQSKEAQFVASYRHWMDKAVADLGLSLLPVTVEYADAQIGLTRGQHRDPFYRLLAAQALVERVPVVSIDAALDQYAVTRIW